MENLKKLYHNSASIVDQSQGHGRTFLFCFRLLHCKLSSPIHTVKTKGYSTDLLDPTQVESKKCSQIQWPVPSINAEPVDIFLGEE